MNEKQNTNNLSEDDLLERFIDGLMSEAEAEAFLASTEDRDQALRQREIQNEIDNSLRRSFKFDAVSADVVTEQILSGFPSKSPKGIHSNSLSSNLASVQKNPLFKLAIAASLLLAIGLCGFWIYGGSGSVEPHFQPRSLAMVYQETNDRGFRPYYNCEDEKRFADTFESRHGHRLALSSEMPDGTGMLGISYPGGISRNTTAMLGEVDGNPVMVFVDDATNRGNVIQAVEPGSNLNVFVVEKNGLIFCEVTPLDSAKLILHFEFPELR